MAVLHRVTDCGPFAMLVAQINAQEGAALIPRHHRRCCW
jgi:hypothetical protein